MSSVYSDKFEGVAFRSGAELAQFEADAQALADVRTLDEWAESQDLDAYVHLTVGRGDAIYWLLALSRVTNSSDPEELDINDRSFYDEDGLRVWEFEGETAEEARAKAAAWVRSQKP